MIFKLKRFPLLLTLALVFVGNSVSFSQEKTLLVPNFSGSSSNVVVLNDGETIRGLVNHSDQIVRVKTRSGFRSFPERHVRIIGQNMKDAYRQLSQTTPTTAINKRMEIVYWCKANSLVDELVKELKLVLILDEKHQEAKELLKIHLPQVEEQSGNLVVGQLARNNNTVVLMGAESETLGGLPAGLAAQFTKRVQPIVRNKCGMSSCHGMKTQTSFQVMPKSRLKKTHRLNSRENLINTLSLINSEQPEQSLLWSYATQPHAGNRQPILKTGRAAEVQKGNLSSWITEIAKYLRDNPEAEITKQLLATAHETQTNVSQNKVSNASDKKAVPELINGVLLDEEVISTTLKKTLPDVFDPNEFNRRR